MKIFTVILSYIMVFVLVISFSGESFHVHYCFSSKAYSLDVNRPLENSINHQSCNCNSAEEIGCEKSDEEACCINSETEKEGVSCCVDITAGSTSDNQYNFQVFKPHFKALSFIIFNSSEPVFFNYYKTNTFDFSKTRDHSPPEIVTSQVLLI